MIKTKPVLDKALTWWREQTHILSLRKKIRRFQKKPVVGFVVVIYNRYIQHHISMYAAALAYYTILSIIPLLLFLISFGSFFIDPERIRSFTLTELSSLMPVAADTIQANFSGVLRYRGTLGTISGLGVLWSASGLFSALVQVINAVWGTPHHHSYLKRRLFGVTTILALTAWILFTLWANTIVTLIIKFPPLEDSLIVKYFPFIENIYSLGSLWLERSLSLITIVLLLILLYRFFPPAPIHWRFAIGIGFVTGLVWELTREAFAKALAGGLLSYPLIYGSLWSLIVPVIWAYWTYILILIGAEIQAYLEERMALRQG